MVKKAIIVERGDINSDSAEVYRLKDNRFAIGYQGHDEIILLRKNAKILKEVGTWTEYYEEVEVRS